MAKSFLKFTEIKDTGKTKVFDVSNLQGDSLGRIGWFAAWRRYTYWPVCTTVYDASCLKEITVFINNLMLDRKIKTQNNERG